MNKEIEIIGASTNNLKSIDVRLTSKATMVIGVSGSGKSSLLSDTLATEANSRMHRYLGISQDHLSNDDVSAYIGQLPPSIHFTQAAFRSSSRTTVGTSSGIITLLRRYFKKYSSPWAEEIMSRVPPPSTSSYAGWLYNHYKGTLTIWIVPERWKYTDGIRTVENLKFHGFKSAIFRSEFDSKKLMKFGKTIELAKFKPLSKGVRHLIEAEVGRLNLPHESSELENLLRTAFNIGGDVIIELEDPSSLPGQFYTDRGTIIDSACHWIHPKVFEPYFAPSNSLLSFNSPSSFNSGACPCCSGLGLKKTVKLEQLINDPNKSMNDGCFSLWTKKNYKYVNIQHKTLEEMRGIQGFSPDIPWNSLCQKAQNLILYGSRGIESIKGNSQYKNSQEDQITFPGFINEIIRRYTSGGSSSALSDYVKKEMCPHCKGTRWSREARALLLGKWRIHEILKLSFFELTDLTRPGGEMEMSFGKESYPLVNSLYKTGMAFVESGLGHIAGERGMVTLSEGESRRSRLATILRSHGNGLALLLDEPTRGLHEDDISRLTKVFTKLKQNHKLIFNDHKLSLTRVADQLLEIGPGAGVNGGKVVYQGSPLRFSELISEIAINRKQLNINQSDDWLTISGAKTHTISNIAFRMPLGKLVSLCGVSGSGKSSLVRNIIVPAITNSISENTKGEFGIVKEGSWDKVSGYERINSILLLEPSSSGRNRRSTIITLLNLAGDLRKFFSDLPESKSLNLMTSDFSLNSGTGRCNYCLGLREVTNNGGWVTCPQCGGSGFGEEILSVKFNGQNISEFLKLPISELSHHSITSELGWGNLVQKAIDLDLGHLVLGSRIDQLSGGEYQRIRIAQTLANNIPSGLLLVLDEPSAGLHPMDVKRLLKSIDNVVSGGRNSVLLVEHNIDIIRNSDWVIEMGPEGGPKGGQIVGSGTPEQISKLNSPTGCALAGKTDDLDTSLLITPMKKPQKRKGNFGSTEDARKWLKWLIGDDVNPQVPTNFNFDNLAISSESELNYIRPYEIGFLDLEIGKFLLELNLQDIDEVTQFAKLWLNNSHARIQIHPFLDEIGVWGNNIPSSINQIILKRLKRMNLDIDSKFIHQKNISDIRVSGERFASKTDLIEERILLIQNAITLGRGFVELVLDQNEVLGQFKSRHVTFDADIPAVTPIFMNSKSFLRNGMGGCPCCKGKGSVQSIPEKLIIASKNTDPLAEDFFNTESLTILRSVRRNNFLPFFKRMIFEGLWTKKVLYSQLDSEAKAILMHGYWCRPSHGSFLKHPTSKQEEVRSWLRWDGLTSNILNEIHRSKEEQWKNQVLKSAMEVDCPLCKGTGLKQYFKAIQLGQKSYFDWIRYGTIEEFVGAINSEVPPSKRLKKLKERIIYCFEPLLNETPTARLNANCIDPRLNRLVYDKVVRSMTRFKVLG